MVRSLALTLSLFASQAAAHTFIWVCFSNQMFHSQESSTNTSQGVYVNGVDQGTFSGVRVPAYNGAPGKGGYNNGPVKDLTSIDMRCNVMGDIPTSDTIKVVPGDSLTFDWYVGLRMTVWEVDYVDVKK
jgi:cellulase